jgi:hypothetical protein
MPYTIFIDTICDGTIPAIHDGNGRVVVFSSKAEAGKELADHMITQYQQVVDGERDIDDVSCEEWVDEVAIDGFGKLSDGSGPYVFDEDSSMAVREITRELDVVTSVEETAECETPYEIVEATHLDGWYVNIITRYSKQPSGFSGKDKVVGWAIEQHYPELLITDEVEVLDAQVVVDFVDWLRAR